MTRPSTRPLTATERHATLTALLAEFDQVLAEQASGPVGGSGISCATTLEVRPDGELEIRTDAKILLAGAHLTIVEPPLAASGQASAIVDQHYRPFGEKLRAAAMAAAVAWAEALEKDGKP